MFYTALMVFDHRGALNVKVKCGLIFSPWFVLSTTHTVHRRDVSEHLFTLLLK